MRSSKAPPNQKIGGKFYPTPPNLASEHPNRNARRGRIERTHKYLNAGGKIVLCEVV